FGEQLHILEHLLVRVAGEAHRGEHRHADLPEAGDLLDDLVRRAGQVDLFQAGQVLVAQGRGRQRVHVRVHAAALELGQTGLVAAADAAHQLWRDRDLGRVAANLVAQAPQAVDAAADVVAADSGWEPALAPARGAADDVDVVATH